MNLEQTSGHNPTSTVDGIEATLRSIGYVLLTAAFGVLPLVFLPVQYAPADYTKTLFVVLAVLLSTIFFSLAFLRSGVIKVGSVWPLGAFAGVGLATLVSALLSGDLYDALISDTFSVHSVAFVALMIFVTGIVTTFGQSKSFIMKTYIALAASAVIVGPYQLLRVFFGADFLSFGVFNSATSSLLGGWNDLALFFGLTILLSLVALEQLPLTTWGRALFGTVVFVSLLMLMVVNFFAVWLVLALVSLVVLMYSLTKDRFQRIDTPFSVKPTISLASILVSAMVLIVSIVFVVGGSVVGNAVSSMTGISYVEVRPSLPATLDIAKSVYAEQAFVGIGPNKFVDAWRLYKSPSINDTIFWATDFPSGSGYLPTQFVTLGVLGVVAWLIFLGFFLFVGFRMLFKTSSYDRFWYFIGTSSFVAATYLWMMAFVYTPGSTMLILASFFTGLTFASSSFLLKEKFYTWSIEQNKRAGILMVGVVMIVIVGSVSSLYYVSRHYTAFYTYAGAISGLDGSASIEEVEQKIVNAFSIVGSDQFAYQIAMYQFGKMNALINVQEPTVEEQEQFKRAFESGVMAADQAVEIDPSNAANHLVRGAIYSLLATVGIEGAIDRTREIFGTARKLDPQNPSYALLEAQLAVRLGNIEEARAKIAEAVAMKGNYTDALFLATQLDVAEGKVSDAIATTKAMISMEPRNPARYYQLGVLLSSDKQIDAAVEAFSQAVALEPNYANARYLLALLYIDKGDSGAAIYEMEKVLELNPDNQQVKNILADLKSGRTFEISGAPNSEEIKDANPVSVEGETVTTTEAPDTSLVVPVNPIGEEPTASAEVTAE